GRLVVAAGGQRFAVGREGQTAHGHAVAVDLAHLLDLLAGDVVDAHQVVVAGDRHPLVVGVAGDAVDGTGGGGQAKAQLYPLGFGHVIDEQAAVVRGGRQYLGVPGEGDRAGGR